MKLLIIEDETTAPGAGQLFAGTVLRGTFWVGDSVMAWDASRRPVGRVYLQEMLGIGAQRAGRWILSLPDTPGRCREAG
ncbi:MAG: hypothetical protein AAGN46_07365 [Acidobacteriota bacterium]